MRHARLAVLILSAVVLFAAGCSWLTPTVKSPWSGQDVTAEQLKAEQDAALAKAKADSDAALAKAKTDADLQTQQLAIDAAQRKAAFERAVARLNSDSQNAIADLQVRYDADSAQAQMAAARVQAAAAAAVSDAQNKSAAAIAEIQTRGAAASGQLQQKAEALATVGGLFAGAGQVAGGFGPIGMAASLLLGGVGTFIGHKVGKTTGTAQAQAEAADDQATLVAKHQDEKDALWDEAQQALISTMGVLRQSGLHLPPGLTLVQPPPAPASTTAAGAAAAA